MIVYVKPKEHKILRVVSYDYTYSVFEVLSGEEYYVKCSPRAKLFKKWWNEDMKPFFMKVYESKKGLTVEVDDKDCPVWVHPQIFGIHREKELMDQFPEYFL